METQSLLNFIQVYEESPDKAKFTNNYSGGGYYAEYSQTDNKGYPIDRMSVFAYMGYLFHDPGCYIESNPIPQAMASNMSTVGSDGLMKVLSGQGEHTISLVRHINRTVPAFVYRVVIGEEVDLRMIAAGKNYKVLVGAPGVYELEGNSVRGYTYDGPFCYERSTGDVVDTRCDIITYLPIPVCSYCDTPGIQLYVDGRLYDWYHDDVIECVVSDCDSVSAVVVSGAKTYNVTIDDEVKWRCHTPNLSLNTRVTVSGDKIVWCGMYCGPRPKISPFDLLPFMFVDRTPLRPENYTICDRTPLEDCSYIAMDVPTVAPYVKSLAIFKNTDNRIFNTFSDLFAFLRTRARTYSFMSLVNSYVTRGLVVSPVILMCHLINHGFVVHSGAVYATSACSRLKDDIYPLSTYIGRWMARTQVYSPLRSPWYVIMCVKKDVRPKCDLSLMEYMCFKAVGGCNWYMCTPPYKNKTFSELRLMDRPHWDTHWVLADVDSEEFVSVKNALLSLKMLSLSDNRTVSAD